MLRASSKDEGRPVAMLYAGLDLSRKRLDFHLLDGEGATLEVGAAPPDGDGLDGLTERLARYGDDSRRRAQDGPPVGDRRVEARDDRNVRGAEVDAGRSR